MSDHEAEVEIHLESIATSLKSLVEQGDIRIDAEIQQDEFSEKLLRELAGCHEMFSATILEVMDGPGNTLDKFGSIRQISRQAHELSRKYDEEADALAGGDDDGSDGKPDDES